MSLIIPIITTTIFAGFRGYYEIWASKQQYEGRFSITKDHYDHELFKFNWWQRDPWFYEAPKVKKSSIPDFEYKGKEYLKDRIKRGAPTSIAKLLFPQVLQKIEQGATSGRVKANIPHQISIKAIIKAAAMGAIIGIILEGIRYGLVAVFKAIKNEFRSGKD